jgi:hypothetical protein
MRALILILSLLSTLTIYGQTTSKEYFIDSTGKDTLKPFQVVFSTGDEVVVKYKITVYYKGSNLYASRTARGDSIGETKLNYKQASACFNFLKKAKSLPNHCQNFSTSIKAYIIVLGNKTIKINGNCDWDGFDYFYLESQLRSNDANGKEIKK